MGPAITPAYTFERFFGHEAVYCQRISPSFCTWLPLGDARIDAMTGGSLTVSGAMSQICSAAVATPDGLQLLQNAGLPVPRGELFRYRDGDEYLQVLQRLTSCGRIVASQYRQGVTELPAASYWIQPEVLSFVNNKANLAALVDQAVLPCRRVMAGNVLETTMTAHGLPFVVKAATDEPTGAGLDVVLCRTPADLARAAGLFTALPQVIMEEYLQMERNLCLNFGITATGEVSYLGCAEQICDDDGMYLGNWFGAEVNTPPKAITVGTSVAEKSFSLGYYGLLGIDMAVLADGQLRVYDLNFRINGSTVPLLLVDSLLETTGRKLAKLDRFVGPGTYQELLDVAYGEMAKGTLIPFSSYDPAAVGHPDWPPRMLVLMVGDSREEIDATRRELAAAGLAGAAFRATGL